MKNFRYAENNYLNDVPGWESVKILYLTYSDDMHIGTADIVVESDLK